MDDSEIDIAPDEEHEARVQLEEEEPRELVSEEETFEKGEEEETDLETMLEGDEYEYTTYYEETED